jgi:Fic family protein
MQNIYSCAGQFRTHSVRIPGSPHKPPSWTQVEGHVENMCQRVNESTDWDGVETAAFLLWRLNWIHPFAGGNGRTSRAVAYLGLCVRVGYLPPGQPTITEHMAGNRSDYIAALRDADRACEDGYTDVSIMQSLIDDLLHRQLSSIRRPPR